MSKVGSWNTTAANNNSAPPDGWPEGQAPSTVNDCAREMMAQIKTMVNNLEYIDLNNTPSFLTANSFSMATADTANFEVGRRVKLFDGGNTLYGYINSVSSTFVQVQLDSGALDSSLSSIAMAVIKQSNNSLPENVYKKKNVIINGSMDIWQRSASFALPTGLVASYTADRFAYQQSATGSVNISRLERSANASNVPSLALSGVLFNNSFAVSVSATDVNANAGEYSAILYVVEGYDWRQLAQKPINLSFWARSNATGTYCVALRNSGKNQSFVKEYSIESPSTWQKYSIPFIKSPSSGTWDYSSGAGAVISWSLKVGSTLQGGANNWTATNVIATSNQTNFFASAGNTFAITGIQLEEGNFGTPLETTNYNDELQRCKRYYQTWTGATTGQALNASQVALPVQLTPVMRVAPTVTSNLNFTVFNAASSLAISLSSAATYASYPGSFITVGNLVGGTGLVAGNAAAGNSSTQNPTFQCEADI